MFCICKSPQPASALPAKVSRVWEFNETHWFRHQVSSRVENEPTNSMCQHRGLCLIFASNGTHFSEKECRVDQKGSQRFLGQLGGTPKSAGVGP